MFKTDKGLSASTPVTLLMPVHNGGQYLATSLLQLQGCARKIDEIIVVNDGSTDSTSEILASWSQIDSRITVLTSERRGLCAALNLGVESSSNEIIARFDVDDKYQFSRLEDQLNCFDNQTVVSFSDYSIHQPLGRTLGTVPVAIFPSAMELSLLTSQRTAHPSAMFRKSAVLDVGGYIEGDFPAEDLSLWLRLAKIGEISGCAKILLEYQRHNNSISSNQTALMIGKKRALLSKFTITKKSQAKLASDAIEMFRLYEMEPMGNLRKILFLRDIALWVNMYPGDSNLREIRNCLIPKILLDPMSFKVFAEEGIRKIVRMLS